MSNKKLIKIREKLGIENFTPVRTLITPGTPFSNKLQIRQTIDECDGYIYWIDKYFSVQGLELLSGFLNAEKIKYLKILMSPEKADRKIRTLFKDFKKEMRNKGISCELRVITNSKLKSQIHDRWIISKYKCFNIPSPDIIARGQYSEITKTDNRPPFEKWWDESLDIITNWDKIENLMVEND
jgi:hypothetical protein